MGLERSSDEWEERRGGGEKRGQEGGIGEDRRGEERRGGGRGEDRRGQGNSRNVNTFVHSQQNY